MEVLKTYLVTYAAPDQWGDWGYPAELYYLGDHVWYIRSANSKGHSYLESVTELQALELIQEARDNNRAEGLFSELIPYAIGDGMYDYRKKCKEFKGRLGILIEGEDY